MKQKPANKVVSISDAASDNLMVEKTAHPAVDGPLQLLQDRSRQLLSQLLQDMFNCADDALFELADRAQSNSEQNIYFESMRDIRLKRRTIEASFSQLGPEAFASLLGPKQVLNEEPEVMELEAGSLSLVQNDELEEQVAIDGIVSRILSADSDALRGLTQRVDSLMSGVDIDENNNPLGPRVICNNFMQACKCLEVDIKSRLVVYKLFEKQLMLDLENILTECNDLLVEQGVLPGLSATAAGKHKRVTEQQRLAAAKHAEELLPDGVQLQSLNDDAGQPDQVFASVQDLMSQQQNFLLAQGLLKTANWFMPGTAPEIPRQQVFGMLSQAQNRLLDSEPPEAMTGQALTEASQSLDVHQLLKSMLAEQNIREKRSIGQVDFDAINLVSMLFQFILDDDNLAAQMKALIARMQIPLLKAAMLDRSFFGTEGHPARKLLNKIATSALGWVPAGEGGADPLLDKVQQTVDTLLADYEQDTSVFESLLQEFELFLEQEERRTSLLEKRAVDAADGKARAAKARQCVQALIDKCLSDVTVPVVVEQLLREAWSNALFLAFVREGEDSEAWREAVLTAEQLIWSVADNQPDRNRAELMTMMPDLLRKLREGLTQISFDPFKMNKLFSELEQVHLRILADMTRPGTQQQGAAEQEVEAAAELVNEPAQAEDIELGNQRPRQGESAEELEEYDASIDELLDSVDAMMTDEPGQSEQARAESLPETALSQPVEQDQPIVASEYLDQAGRLGIGSWIEVATSQDSRYRAKLVAVTPPDDTHIFVNRAGMKVLELTLLQLAAQIRDEQVKLLDDGALFDRALQSVIGNLREIKKPVA